MPGAGELALPPITVRQDPFGRPFAADVMTYVLTYDGIEITNVRMARGVKDEFLQIRVSAKQKAAIRRQASRAGLDMSSWILAKAIPAAQEQFATFAKKLARADRYEFLLAELNDWFAKLTAEEFSDAVSENPRVSLGEYLANYIAAMIEVTAHQKKVSAPDWLDPIKPLEHPVFHCELQGLRLYLLTHAPPPFRRRNIFVDATVGDRV